MIAVNRERRIFCAFKHPHDVPSWVTHLIYAGSDSKIVALGPRSAVLQILRDTWRVDPEEYLYTAPSIEAFHRASPWVPKKVVKKPQVEKKTVVEMCGVQIRHGNKVIVGDWKQNVNENEQNGLWWKVKTGERWGLFGPNGRRSFITPHLFLC